MKTISEYPNAKNSLKSTANMAKSQFPTDKPMIRMIINDSIDFLVSEYNLSENETYLLQNYACTLHP
jgi:hypothetical protein